MRKLTAILLAALMLPSAPSICRAETTAVKDGDKVVLQNEQVKVEYDLTKGTYAAYCRKDKTSNIVDACLRIDEFSSNAAGLTHTWESAPIKDELGMGRKLLIKTSGPGKPDLILEIALYDDRSFLALSGGVKNTLGQSIRVKEINPLYHGKAFDGVGVKSDLRMLNGPGGAGCAVRFDGPKGNGGHETRAHSSTNLESPNNLLVTFVTAGQRKSIVLGGLTYHDYSKYASASRGKNDEITASIMSWDPVGKRVDSGASYLPDDRCYVDFCTANPFDALEKYGLSIRAAQKVKLMINDFPTVCGWYVAVFGGGGGTEPNNTAGMVAQMDAVIKSGFLRYSKVAVRVVPDDYGANNEQGWWDEEHWQKYGHYVKPYETTKKWAQAVIERGGIPLTYSQTGSTSRDFIAAHPDWYLFNDTKRLFGEKGNLTFKTALDFTDPGFKAHLRKVYENMRDGGLAGLMFDYPESSFRLDGGFEDNYATAAAAYRTIFEIPKTILGPESYIDERNIWSQPIDRGCFMDVTAGVVDSQRVWGDTDVATPEMYSRCGHRWYKNRVIFTYDMDSKNLFKVSPNNRDGLRQLLTMVYTVAPRFVLASSFSKMTPEQLHDLSRIYPIHDTPRSARPLDAFTREDGIPRIYDYAVDKTWHQLVFYNPDVMANGTIGVEIGKDSSFGGMGLDPGKSYYVYDFWNEAFLGKFPGAGKLEQVLRPGEVRMMSVHELANHPQFISTNRHVMQGYVDMLKTDWDPSGKKLTGTSKVVGGETYKVVIALNGHKPASCSAKGAKAEIKVINNDAGGIAFLSIDTAENGTVDWSVLFNDQGLKPGDTIIFAESGDSGRSYVRTSRGDLAKESFQAELTATLKGGGGAGCAFFGMGCGQGNASACLEPSTAPSFFVRLAPGDFGGGVVTVSVNGREFQCGSKPAGDGTHRLRLTWDAAGKLALFEIDANWDGKSFKADSTATLRAGSVDFGEAGHLFVGGANGVRFDDFALKAMSAAEVQAAGFGEIFANDPLWPLYQEPLRPQFHFTARYWGDGYNIEPGADLAIPGRGGKEGWINDVNGPIYFDGEYHLFAQRWWHCWLHAVSKDLVHWEELKPAFGQDDEFGGTQSGSCVIDYRNVSGLATGSTPVMIAFWSATDNQRQCISFSNDRGRSWTKYDKNPVLVHPYRDPKVFWHEPSQKWVMVLCGPPDFHYYILTSANLLQWEEQSKIPDMYECPDMFPLPLDGDASKTKWVIINGDGKYLVGDFDGREFKPLTGKKRCEWGENFYAAQSWHNMPQNDPRRIQIAWMAWGKYPKMPFNQQLTFPCELTLRTTADGPALQRYPIREIEKLWDEKIELGAISLEPGDDPLAKLTGKYYDIDLEIDLAGSEASEIALELAGNKVRYLVKEKIVENCGARAALSPVANRVALRILLDRTSIEVFGNHGTLSLTKTMLPDDSKPPLAISAVGGKAAFTRLTLHKLKSMWPQTANEAKPAGARR